jgi:hypothetical protein
VVERISFCYKIGPGSAMNMEGGGVGIGCYMMIEQSNSFLMAVQPGKKSVVGAAVLLGLPKKLILSIPKNLHCVFRP